MPGSQLELDRSPMVCFHPQFMHRSYGHLDSRYRRCTSLLYVVCKRGNFLLVRHERDVNKLGLWRKYLESNRKLAHQGWRIWSASFADFRVGKVFGKHLKKFSAIV